MTTKIRVEARHPTEVLVWDEYKDQTEKPDWKLHALLDVGEDGEYYTTLTRQVLAREITEEQFQARLDDGRAASIGYTRQQAEQK